MLVAATVLATGCGAAATSVSSVSEASTSTETKTTVSEEASTEEEGEDWRTTRDFGYLPWNTPDGPQSLVCFVFEEDGQVMVAPDEETYNPQFLSLVDGVHDFDTVRDKMYTSDFNNDGYDDISIDDVISGARVSEVFVYNPENKTFEYDDSYSTVRANLQEISGEYAGLAGDWSVDGSLKNGYLSISADGSVTSYSYEGTVNYEGTIRREQHEHEDGTTEEWFNIYDDGDECVIGFAIPDDEDDMYELYSGQDGAIRFVRSDHCTND